MLKLLQELKGQQLSSVTFVQDYLQLWFDGPGINVNNPLTVKANGDEVTSWDTGFRDLLCSLITKKVEGYDFKENEYLNIYFEDEASLSVSLKAKDYVCPEAVYLHGFNGGEWIVN